MYEARYVWYDKLYFGPILIFLTRATALRSRFYVARLQRDVLSWNWTCGTTWCRITYEKSYTRKEGRFRALVRGVQWPRGVATARHWNKLRKNGRCGLSWYDEREACLLVNLNQWSFGAMRLYNISTEWYSTYTAILIILTQW